MAGGGPDPDRPEEDPESDATGGGNEPGGTTAGTDEADGEADGAPGGIDRRRALAYGGLALLLGAGGLGAYDRLAGGGSAADPTPTVAPPTGTPADEMRALVDRYAPDLHFGRRERWYPTDPTPYTQPDGDRTVVDGPTALVEYADAMRAGDGTPPAPTVYYHVAEAADGVIALQYWMYSVFDQFSVNFHWHDWELLQVFVTADGGEPVLLSASAHSRLTPNNESLDPAGGDDWRPRVLAEVGSHSSATDVNRQAASFERFDVADLAGDITNDLVDVAAFLDAPIAYGLPRDEGARLPYVLPELEGHLLYEHPDLPGIGPEDLVDADVTVRDWTKLAAPPADLPTRERGLVLTHPDSAADGDATYDLTSITTVREAVDDFVGPQLGFEFAIPDVVEDAYADHITSAGIPWHNDRFADPLADVVDGDHRRAVVEAGAGMGTGAGTDGGGASDGTATTAPSTSGGTTNAVVGVVRQVVDGADGYLANVTEDERDALADWIPVSLGELPAEVVVRLSSDPVAVPTNRGLFAFQNVESGAHSLVVDGPGYEPAAHRFDHDGATTRLGGEGVLGAVAREDAVRIVADAREGRGIDRFGVVEDFAGPLAVGRPYHEDRVTVAVHRAGRYTVEFVDRQGVAGATRVVPAGKTGPIEVSTATGKAALASTLASRLRALQDLAIDLAERDGARGQVIEQLGTAANDAERAAAAARDGQGGTADELLARVRRLLEEIRATLGSEGRDGYSEASASLLDRRVADADELAGRAIAAPTV